MAIADTWREKFSNVTVTMPYVNILGRHKNQQTWQFMHCRLKVKSLTYSVLALLSHGLSVTYCHQPMSIVHRQQFPLNDIFSETTTPRALICVTKHCLVDLYQVCSNSTPGVQNSSAVGGLGFENKIYLKIFFSRTARLRCLKFSVYSTGWTFYTKVVQWRPPGSKWFRPRGSWG